jgi:hypothetical protein
MIILDAGYCWDSDVIKTSETENTKGSKKRKGINGVTV